jgi:hemoglobin-like flavoprotein
MLPDMPPLNQALSTAVSARRRTPAPAGPELTARQKRLLRETLTRLAPASDLVAALFYRRLVEIDPSLQRQLKGPLKAQGRQFMGVLKLAILSLDDPAGLQPTLNLLSKRRRRSAMAAGHCLTFSRALNWTFEQSLEARFTREARQAWSTLLAEISRIMADWSLPSSVYGRLWTSAI